MGLIQAAIGAVSSTLADQYKEFFYCDALPNNVIVSRGHKKVDGRVSNKGNDNVISNGSVIAVADGQCIIIVEQGHVVDICAVPGEYRFDTSSEPSIFSGDLGQSIIETFKTIGRRISFGGSSGKDQRVYYFNIKEIKDNKFGTQNPVPFRVVDKNIGLDIDVTIRCNGVYSYKITDPMLFYTNVCGNIEQDYKTSDIDQQLRSEFLSALGPAFAKISEMGIRYSALPGHTTEIADAMNAELSKKWSQLRGISIVSVAINNLTIPEEDQKMITEAQRTGMMRDANYAAATLVNAQAEAMKTAAGNAAGAMNGFMGMNMAAGTGGINAQNLFAMGQQQDAQQTAAPAGSWTCACGTVNTGKFCSECASPKPAPAGQWTCSCGTVNTGKFCSECASPKPSAEWTCSCGTVNTGKFCSECASPRP